ncbi:MAG: hypothetical protein U1F26_13855 [Lysobacterales bacterium]
MKLRTWAGVCALAIASSSQAATLDVARGSFCDMDRQSGTTAPGQGELNCRVDVSAPTDGLGLEYSRERAWDNPNAVHFQVCSDWAATPSAPNRSMSFAELDVRAPDKPTSKALLVFSARQSAGAQYLVIDWISPTSSTATASGVLASSVPVAVLPISACTPILTDPYWNIGTEVTVKAVSTNEIEVRVGSYAPIKVKARLGSNLQVAPTKLTIKPLIYDFADFSVIRTLWFPN